MDELTKYDNSSENNLVKNLIEIENTAHKNIMEILDTFNPENDTGIIK